MPLTKASNAELWYCLWSAPEQTVEQTIKMLVIWEATTLIMTSFSYPVRAILKILWKFVHSSLLWRHNGHDNVSNHQPHGCLPNRLFRRRSKKTSKLRVTGLCVGNSPGPVNSPHKGPVTRKMFPFDDVIMFFSAILHTDMHPTNPIQHSHPLKRETNHVLLQNVPNLFLGSCSA